MTHIGKVIYEFRSRNEMSRKELAEGICSEQYVYLIEKGERTPSAEVSAQFSAKLGIDLFEYYYYLSADEPIVVYEMLKKIIEKRRTMDFEGLSKITKEALIYDDFHKSPWCYEIELNRLSHRVFVEQEWQEVIVEIKKIFNDFELTNENDKYYINLSVLLSTCYQMGGEFNNAELATLAAGKILNNKMSNRNYKQEITSVNLNLMTVYYYQGKYNETFFFLLHILKMRWRTMPLLGLKEG